MTERLTDGMLNALLAVEAGKVTKTYRGDGNVLAIDAGAASRAAVRKAETLGWVRDGERIGPPLAMSPACHMALTPKGREVLAAERALRPAVAETSAAKLPDTPTPQHRTAAQIVEDWKRDRALPYLSPSAVRDLEARIEQAVNDAIRGAAEAIDDLRCSAAGDFMSPNCQGQRGQDRTDALYDAYQVVAALGRNGRVD